MASTCKDWELWCATTGARSPAEKDLDGLPPGIQGTFFDLMESWLEGSLRVDGDSCKSFGEKGILYLRCRKGTNQYRLYFVMEDDIAVVLHACYKNQQRVDKKTKAMLLKRAASGTSRPFS